ncbi:hypothetical protein [Aliiroseovarius sediminis]|uniref:hypothetical protein n=1 Tax=Aliiroseovarius sediminis TaxID=2925839 RepID=UPI001F59CD6F|nr:hypothetical protein [Aliiroseovarius sediminis]MCI2392888.1 hypothetical protein [Aliiroseovarius sediminis]
MNDISELETRITTALERISVGLSTLSPQTPGAEDDIARLTAALEEERTAKHQLADRMNEVQEGHATELDALRAELERLTAQLATDEVVITRLRQANADLRENNDALRKAIDDGAVDADLVNSAMAAELEGVRVAQTADRAELDAVLGELGHLIAASAPDASGGDTSGNGKEGTDA